eukprot:121040_1
MSNTKFVRFLNPSGDVREGFENPSDGETAIIIKGDILGGGYTTTDETDTISKRLCPLPITPPVIYCIGLNYAKHVAEAKAPTPTNPLVFCKSPTSLCGPEDEIVLPRVCEDSDQLDFEAELAIVIGKKCKDVSPSTAFDYILGFTTANDVSARDWQLKPELSGGQFVRGKSFDTFCPIGPCIALTGSIDPNKLRITSKVNGETMQDACTDDMIFDVASLVSFLSLDTTLLPGTLILTGTPCGVGFARRPPVWLRPGDEVECCVEGIGTIRNTIVAKVGE